MSNEEKNPAAGQTTPPESEGKISIWSIILGIFYQPTRAFQDLKKRPRVLIPILVVLVLAAVTGIATQHHGAVLQMQMMEKSKLPAQVVEQLRANADKTSPAVSGGTTAAVYLVINLIVAALAMFWGNVVLAGKAKFKAILAVTMVAGVIEMAGGILRLPLVYAKDSLLVSYGLAAFFPGKDFTSFLYSFFYQYDIFVIWGIIAAGIGYGIIFGLNTKKGLYISILSSGLVGIAALILRAIGLMMVGVEVSFF